MNRPAAIFVPMHHISVSSQQSHWLDAEHQKKKKAMLRCIAFSA